MKSITGEYGTIHFDEAGYQAMNNLIASGSFSSIFVLVDSNTHEYCLPYFLSRLETDVRTEVMEMEPGEEHKNLETCWGVWEALNEYGADRKSLMINLGGGVVTDLGGFVASTFKRGIRFINVPTSLLAMVDASIGGKTGVDLGVLKNQIGVINMGDMVLIDTGYLETLPENHMRSGMAEMFKHGLIADAAYWKTMAESREITMKTMDALIYDSVGIKYQIVQEDPMEHSIRKALNFGHTLGHAIESYFLDQDDRNSLLHGEAIAVGMIMETYLSVKICGLPMQDADHIKSVLLGTFDRVDFNEHDKPAIIELLKHDKKNVSGMVNFVLLPLTGSFKLDCQAGNALILEAFDYYEN
ncbi:MAG: 3-dehydroquinate synthase [Flavobacteriaceae bacterium]|nr:3-dehydroquinate synthase [Flavobacteriaceae bacterium]